MTKQDLDLTFQALADPTRRAILARLVQAPASVTDLAQHHAMALPSFLAHVRKLEAGGLIQTHKAGRIRMCQARPERLRAAEAYLGHLRQDWMGRLDRLDQFLTQHPNDEP